MSFDISKSIYTMNDCVPSKATLLIRDNGLEKKSWITFVKFLRPKYEYS